MDDVLQQIASIANRSKSQANFLYELCDKDMAKYIYLEALLANKLIRAIPADKETLEYLLKSTCSIQEKEFTDSFRWQTSFLYKKSIEVYMFQYIKTLENDLKDLESKKEEYSTQDYTILFHRITAQKEMLYMCLTAHNNTYKK